LSIVVDASVVLKWFIPENDSEQAAVVLGYGDQFVVPDFLFAEVANALRVKMRRGELADREARAILKALHTVPFVVEPSLSHIQPALDIANETRITVFDGLYIAVAVASKAAFATADRRLLRVAARYVAVDLLIGVG
jgi:predicted nucleic acid-binding protein